jgi:hypothetical protein
MKITVIYDNDGKVIAVSIPDADNGQQLGCVPQEGQLVLEVDRSTLTQELVRGDESQVGFNILSQHRVDTTTKQLVPR